MVFNGKDGEDAEKARERLEKLIRDGKRFELKEIRPSLTNQQNKTVHMWFGCFADFTGEEDRARVKQDVITHLVGTVPYYSTITGRMEEEVPHISGMGKQQLSDFMERFKVWAWDEYKCYLPYYGDAGYDELCKKYW